MVVDTSDSRSQCKGIKTLVTCDDSLDIIRGKKTHRDALGNSFHVPREIHVKPEQDWNLSIWNWHWNNTFHIY